MQCVILAMTNAIELVKTIVILLNDEMARESVFSSLTHVLIDRATNTIQAHTAISLDEIYETQCILQYQYFSVIIIVDSKLHACKLGSFQFRR